MTEYRSAIFLRLFLNKINSLCSNKFCFIRNNLIKMTAEQYKVVLTV